jgi:hypothetical protein
MRAIDEYKRHANECRKLAAGMTRIEDKMILEDLARAWENVAKLRERDLTGDNE